MKVNYYLHGKDESKDIEYFLHLASDVHLPRINECKKFIGYFQEWWEEGGSIPNKFSLNNVPVEVLEFITLFRRILDTCIDYKHFVVSIILQWYGGNVVDEFAVKKKIPEDVKAVVVLEPDISFVEINENPNYKSVHKEPQ